MDLEWQLRKMRWEREDCRRAEEQILYSRAIRSCKWLLEQEKERRRKQQPSNLTRNFTE
jgi:hypothetical protein